MFACQCASFLRPNKWNEFASKTMKLPWTFGGYYQTTHYLQPNHPAISKTGSRLLEPSYSMKSVHMQGVNPQDRIYQSNENSYTQSMVFAPEEANKEESPAVLTRVGKGWLGWQGDVNAEIGTMYCILAMLGLPLTDEIKQLAEC